MGPIKRRKKAENSKVDQNGMDGDDALIHLAQQRQPLDWWDEFSKRFSGSLSKLKGRAKFESVLRISRRTFDYICSLVKEDMEAKPSHYIYLSGKPLSFNEQVAVALRRLTSGESLNSIGESFGMHHSTVSNVTWRFVESMENRALHHLTWPSSEAEMKEVKSKFEKIKGLPNCCGAIDITHIAMTLPAVENHLWLDREKNCSMILQVVVDPEMRIRDVFTGWPGSLNDDTVLRSTGLFERCEEVKRLNGEKVELSQGSKLREYIVGDVGFPLLPWLLTPYRGKSLTEWQLEFNKRHYATRMVAQRALVKLKEMWRVIQGVMWKPDKNKLPRIILVCCLLHNIVIDLEDEAQDEMPLSRHHDLGYRQQVCQSADQTASIVRDDLSLYLSGKFPTPDKLSPLSSGVGNPSS